MHAMQLTSVNARLRSFIHSVVKLSSEFHETSETHLANARSQMPINPSYVAYPLRYRHAPTNAHARTRKHTHIDKVTQNAGYSYSEKNFNCILLSFVFSTIFAVLHLA